MSKFKGLAGFAFVVVFCGVPALSATPESQNLGDKDGRIRAQFAPRNEVVISSELSAKIAVLNVRDGDSFRAGQLLVGFDCSLHQAQLNKAEATKEAAEKNLSVSKRLTELNSIGALELQQSEAKAKESQAEVAYMKATVSRCGVAAPFSGRVGKRLVANHQYVTPGTPLLSLIDTAELEIQLIVPSKWLAWIKPGMRFGVQVDELGANVTGKVSRIGARIDPVSQSVAIVGVVDTGVANLRPGMSGWATFPNQKRD